MKLITLGLIVFAVACSAEYNKKQLQEILKVGKECMKELSIPWEDNIIDRVMHNNGATRRDMRFLCCTYRKWNMLDANDQIIADKVVEFMLDQYDEQLVRPVIEKCAKQDDPFVYERLWQCYQCFFAEKSFQL